MLIDYNKNINFVDNFDCLKNDYSLDRKSMKWYLRLVYHFVECAITNAFFIHKEIDIMPKFSNKNVHRNVYNDLLSTKIISIENKYSPSVSKARPSVI